MADNYQLVITVVGEDQTAPAVQGMERLGVGGIAAGNLLASAMQAAAGAVTGFVGASISAAGDFQTNMSVLQAASGATAAQMDQLSATAMALGNDMQLPGASAGDAATAMLELSKAGLTVDQTMAAAKGTLQLAAAAETDAATAAGVVAGALNAFHLEGTAAAQIADQLAAGANASAASMTDLSQGFQAAGFAFNATGQHTDDLIASLSMLTNVGLTGSDAGTALKNAMMQLMAPTDAAAKTMAQYGINVRDAQGNMLPFRDIIGVLQTRLGGLSAAQREMALKTILQGDGMKAMLPLLEAGVSGFDAMKAKVNQAGAAQDMAAAQMAGFNGAMGGLSNAVETLQLVIGGALLPVLTFLINTIAAPAINAITTFIMALQGNADAIAQLAPPIQALMGFLSVLWSAVSEVVGAFNEAGTYSFQFAGALAQLGAALGLPMALLPTIVFGIQNLISAVWPAIDAIGAFAVGAGDFATVADLLIELFGVTIGGLLADAVGVVYDYAQVWIDLGTTIANVVAALLGGDLAGAWTALTSGFAQVVADYQMYATSLGQLLLDTGTAIVTNVLTWGQAFVDWIAPYIPPALAALSAFAAQLWGWVVAQAPIWLQQLATWGQALIDWIAPYASLAVTALGTWVAGLWAWVQAQAPGWIAQLAAWGAAFVDWIAPVAGPALGALGDLLGQFLSWIGAQVGPIIAQLGVWASAFVAWIPGATVSFLAAWPGMLSSFLDWIAGAVGPILAQLALWAGAFLGWIGPMIPPFLAQIGAMIPPLLIALAGIALAIVTWVAETAVVIVGKVASWAGAMLGWIGANVLPALPGLLAGIVTAITSFIGGAVKSLLSEGAKIGTAVVDGIKQGLSSAWGKVTAWLAEKVASIPAPIRQIMGIHSPSQVMADQVGAPIVDGIAMGIKTASPKAVGAMLDLANKLIDVVSKGVDAFGKLSQLGTIPQGAVQRFADSIMGALTVFSAMTQTWDKGSMSAASQFTKKTGDVVDMLAKGVDFLLKLQTLQAIPAQAIHTFVSALDLTMRELVAISTQQMRIGLMGAVEFAGGAGKLLEVVGKGVESLSKLSTFQAVPLTAFLAFRAALKSAIYTFTQAVQEWSTAPIASAAAFADSSGKMLDVIGKGAESLSKLAEFTGVPLAAFQAFRANLKSAIYTFTQAATEWAGAPVGAAVQFAQTSATVLDTIGKGVDSITKLAGFKGVPLEAFLAFRAALNSAVYTFTQAATQFQASAVEAAGVFATSAGKVTAIIGSAVDGFTKLAEFKGVTDLAFVDFGSALFYTVDLFVAMAADWDAKAVDAASTFAVSAGKVVGILGSGVEGFTKLADLRPVADGVIQIFVAMINDLMIRIGAAASGFSADAIAAAGKFADAAGKTVGILKTGVEGLLFVDTFAGVSQDAIERFGAGVRMAVAKMAQLAAEFGVDATQAAQAFAVAAGESTDFLKKGVDGFVKLDDLTAVPQQALDVFAQAVVALINTIIRLSGVLSTDVLLQANTFAKSIDSVITIIKGGLEAMTKMGEETGNIQIFTQRIINSIADISAALVTQAKPASMNIGANIALGIAAGITSQAGAIQNAVYAAVNQALAAARAALGIASPSKVFEQQIGVQMSAGMAQGVLGGIGQVQSAVSQVSGGAVGGVGGTTNNNQRTFAPGAIQIQVIAGDSKNARATADEVATELERRLGLVG